MYVTHNRTGRYSVGRQSNGFRREQPCCRIYPMSHTSYCLRGEESLMTRKLNEVI